MSEVHLAGVFVLRLLAAALVGAVVVFTTRAVSRRLPVAGTILALGIVARAVVGVALFTISYLQLPALRSMQLGGGFWTLAPDAVMYFRAAAGMVERGHWAVPAQVPSPAFVRVLAGWMMLVGVSPAAAVLLNIVCYAVAVYALVRVAWRWPSAGVAAVVAITASPALLVFGTQPLKDAFFALLIAGACVGLAAVVHVAGAGTRLTWKRTLAVLCLPVSYYLMAGIRPYYPLFLFPGLAAAMTAVVAHRRRAGLARRLAYSVATLLVAVSAWTAGLGPYFAGYVAPTARSLGIRIATAPGVASGDEGGLETAAEHAREGFIRSGGATNFGRSVPGGAKIQAVAVGLLVLTVPIAILEPLGVVSLTGSRAFLALADLDTVFVDASVLALAVLIFRRRRRSQIQWPYLVFTAIAVGVGSVAIGYVVTNFGTLFRLRLLLAVPLWMIPIGIAPPAQTAMESAATKA